MKTYYWCSSSGRIDLVLTMDEAQTGSHQGQCQSDVEYLLTLDNIKSQTDNWDVVELSEELRDFGCWSEEELKDHRANVERMLWIACCDVKESPELYA